MPGRVGEAVGPELLADGGLLVSSSAKMAVTTVAGLVSRILL